MGYAASGYPTVGVGSTIHSEPYRELLTLLRERRRTAGLNQADLAARIGRRQTWLSKVETGERRIDVEELRQLCVAMDVDFLDFVRKWLKSISKSQGSLLP